VLARLDEPLGLAESCRLDEYDNLLFWCWVEDGRLKSVAFQIRLQSFEFVVRNIRNTNSRYLLTLG
jgi:hypothetical protein